MAVGDYTLRIEDATLEISVTAEEVDERVKELQEAGTLDDWIDEHGDMEAVRRRLVKSLGWSKLMENVTGVIGQPPEKTVLKTTYEGVGGF